MAWARQEEQWDHTSAIMAMVFNVKAPKSKQIDPSKLNPMRKRVSTGVKRTNSGNPLSEFKRCIVKE